MFLNVNESPEKLKNLLASFSSRNYRWYFAGQSMSLIGTWMQNIAMSWLVYRLTGSVFLLGVVGFASQIPSFFFSPFAGAITDKYNRKKIMIWTQVCFMLQALLFAILTLANVIEVWHIIALSLMFGFITVFDTPARQSLVIDLVNDRQNLGNAIALNSAMFNGARLVGPGIAGIIIAYTGEGICFLINAFSFLVIIIALSQIVIKNRQSVKTGSKLWADLKEGFQYTFGSAPIKLLIIVLSLVSLMGLPYSVLLPAYAREILGGDSKTLGFLMSSAGMGALLAALFLASRRGIKGLSAIISNNLLLFGFGIAGLALTDQHFLNDFAISISIPFETSKILLRPANIIMFLCGFGMIASIAGINTLIQFTINDEMRGRVMGFYAIALMGMNPVGSFLAGSSASAFGLKNTLLAGGIVCVVTGAFFAIKRKQFKEWS